MKNLLLIIFVLLLIGCDSPTAPALEQKPSLSGTYYYQDDKIFISYEFYKNGQYVTISNFEDSHLEGHGTYTLKDNELCLNLKTYCLNNTDCSDSQTGAVCNQITLTSKSIVFYTNDSLTTYEKVFK